MIATFKKKKQTREKEALAGMWRNWNFHVLLVGV